MRRKLPIIAAAMATASLGISGVALEHTDDRSKENREILRQLARISRDAIHESCVKDERLHRRDVEDLRDTYRYVTRIAPEERSTTLNRAVLQSLPKAERQVRDSRPPAYCADRGVGLAGRLPRIPARPRGVDVPRSGRPAP